MLLNQTGQMIPTHGHRVYFNHPWRQHAALVQVQPRPLPCSLLLIFLGSFFVELFDWLS